MDNFSHKTALRIANDLMPKIITEGDPAGNLLKYAREHNLSPGEVRVIGTAYNTVRANLHYKTAADRASDFPVVNAEDLERDYAAELPARLRKVANTTQEPHKVPENQEHKKPEEYSKKLLRLYRRRHGLDEDTGEDLDKNRDKPIPSFEEWKADDSDKEKAASLLDIGVNLEAVSAEALAPNPWRIGLPSQVKAASAPVVAEPVRLEDIEKEASSLLTGLKLKAGQAMTTLVRKCAGTDLFRHGEATFLGAGMEDAKETADIVAAHVAKTGLNCKRASRPISRLTDESEGVSDMLKNLHVQFGEIKEASVLLGEVQAAIHARFKTEIEADANARKTMADLFKEAAIQIPAGGTRRGPARPTTATAPTPASKGEASPNPNPRVERPKREEKEEGKENAEDFKLGPTQHGISSDDTSLLPSAKDIAGLKYPGLMDDVAGRGTLQTLLKAISYGANPGQKHLDETHKRLGYSTMLRDIMANDQVISHHVADDPERVANTAASLIDLSPGLASNKAVMTYALREALSHDSVPISTATALLSGEKAKTDTEKTKREFNKSDYGSDKTFGDIITA